MVEQADEARLEWSATAADACCFRVPRGAHGRRLDVVLADWVPEVSRSHIQNLLKSGHVRLDGQIAARASQKVVAGQRIDMMLVLPPSQQVPVAQDIALNVVHEDVSIIVLNKPADLVVHPASGHWDGTLLNGLLARYPECRNLPRAGIVHRLDKDTSGLLVVGRSEAAIEALACQFARRTAKRHYLALAHGHWERGARLECSDAIGRDPWRRTRMAVRDEEQAPAKDAKTLFSLLHNGPDACFLRCELHTGRTHQIRVHLQHLGHPLLGDRLYGGKPLAGMDRQALHASSLGIRHPDTREWVVFEAQPPADFMAAMGRLGWQL